MEGRLEGSKTVIANQIAWPLQIYTVYTRIESSIGPTTRSLYGSPCETLFISRVTASRTKGKTNIFVFEQDVVQFNQNLPI